MFLDKKKINEYSKGRDWYLALIHDSGAVVIVFRDKSLEILPAQNFAKGAA